MTPRAIRITAVRTITITASFLEPTGLIVFAAGAWFAANSGSAPVPDIGLGTGAFIESFIGFGITGGTELTADVGPTAPGTTGAAGAIGGD
jgi:hypothetical protein